MFFSLYKKKFFSVLKFVLILTKNFPWVVMVPKISPKPFFKAVKILRLFDFTSFFFSDISRNSSLISRVFFHNYFWLLNIFLRIYNKRRLLCIFLQLLHQRTGQLMGLRVSSWEPNPFLFDFGGRFSTVLLSKAASCPQVWYVVTFGESAHTETC